MDPLLEARHQLASMRKELERTNSDLYRHLALYLQVLRDGLLPALQQACFHLATQVYPDRYCQLTAKQRSEFHDRIIDLVRRASALLTVEQVAAMAAQINRQEERRRGAEQRQLLQALTEERSVSGQHHDRGDQHPGDQAPPGSIQLGLAPPIDPRRLDGMGLEWRMGWALDPDRGLEADLQAELEPAVAPGAGDAADPSSSEAQASLASLLESMAEALEPGADPEGEAAAPSPTAAAGTEPSPWATASLPTDPPALLRWLEGYEKALGRRLRNLSHALNVDCLRLGVTRGLLPVGLLDAALNGQVEPQQAPTNLLRLAVPLEAELTPGPMELVAVLLRLSDLELDQPPLRTCRSRLQRHQQEVRRMAQHYRRVQRRVRTLEAERLWLEENSRPTSSSAPGPPPVETRPSKPLQDRPWRAG